MLKNIGSNWALAVIQIIVMIQLTPVQVRALGEEVNGVWLLVASLTSVLSILILGVPMASVRFIAKHAATKDVEKVNQAVASCLGIYLALGLGAAVVGAALAPVFERVYLDSPAWEALTPYWRDQARLAYWISVLQVTGGFASQLPFGILEAYLEFVPRNGVAIAGLLMRLGLTVFVLPRYPTITVVALIQVSAMIVEFTAALVFVKLRCPGVRFGLAGFDRSKVKEILGFSLYVMLVLVGYQLSFKFDQLVIGRFLEPAQGTYFMAGNIFFTPLTGLVLGIGTVIMPLSAKLQAQGKLDQLKPAFLKYSKLAFSLSLMVGVYLIVLGPEFVAWFMNDPSYAGPAGRIVVSLMAAFLFFLPIRGVALPMLMGLGKPERPAVAVLAMGIGNLVISIALAKPLGIWGVALGTAIPCVLFAIAVGVMACRELKVSGAEFLGYLCGKPLVGVIPPVLFLVWLKYKVHAFPLGAAKWGAGFVHLFLGGAGMVTIFAGIWIVFVYRNDPYMEIPARLARFLPRALRGKAR